MRIKLFLTQLKNATEKTFPTLTVNFFVSRRNRNVHMGLNRPLHSIENFMEMLQFIENLWNEKKKNGDELFIFCRYPEIVHSLKWRYDYLLFKKKKKKLMLLQYHLKEFHLMQKFCWKLFQHQLDMICSVQKDKL